MIDVKKVLELYSEESTITDVAKKYCQLVGMEYSDSIRRKMSTLINKFRTTSDSETQSNQYENDVTSSPVLSALSPSGRLMSIDQYCEAYGLDRSSVRSFKLITHTGIPYYNIVFADSTSEVINDAEFITETVKKYINPVDEPVKELKPIETFDRIIISDVHIGMDNTGGKNIEPIFNNVDYTAEEIKRRFELVVGAMLENKTSNTLVIDNLGDFVDGMGGKTTRGGHTLPQNMSDKEVYDLGIGCIINMVESLLKYYDYITVNNVINDNHGFMMGYFIHKTCQEILQTKYPKTVSYILHERFISHYTIGKHTLILCHGKDASDMKHGMKLYADDRIINKIDNYCKEYGLYNGNLIEFSKGDLHKYVFDSNPNDFDYVNYPSFAPPSNWIQTNFGNIRSGFVIQNLEVKTPTKKTTVKWF